MFFDHLEKMTVRSQKIKAVAELVSGKFDASPAENDQSENYVAGPSKSPKIQPAKLDQIKTSLGKEIMSYLKNQKEMLKLVAPVVKKL